MIQEFGKDIVKYLPSRVTPAIVGLITIPIVTHLFSPESYGNYVLVVVTVSVVSVITTAWLSTAIIRFFPAYRSGSNSEEFHVTVITLITVSIVIMSLLFWGILSLLKAHLSSDVYPLMRLGMLVFGANAYFEILLSLLRAKRRAGWYSFLSVWRSIATITIGVGLVMIFHYGVDGLLWGSFLAMVIGFPLLYKVAMGRIRIEMRKPSIRLATSMAIYGFPLTVECLGNWLLSLSDRYILWLYREPSEVGLYSAGYEIADKSILLAVSLLMIPAGPIVIQLWEKKGEQASREFMNKIARYFLIICFPAAVGISVLSKPLISVLTASPYHEANRVVPLVAFGAFLYGLQWLFEYGLILRKKTKAIMTCVLGSCFLNLGLNILLVPRYGYMAAAATTLSSYAFLLASIIVTSRKTFTWPFPYQSLAKVTCASVVMGIMVYHVGNSLTSLAIINLVVGICLGALVYFMLLFLFREPQQVEIQLLRKMRERVLRGRQK